MKPRTMASSPEISMTTINTISSSVIGIGYQSARSLMLTRPRPRAV
jgi:hypothetical protein